MPKPAPLRRAVKAIATTTHQPSRQRVNLSLDVQTVQEARALGLNLSRLVDEKLAEAVRLERARRWEEENREALEYHRKRIARDGMWNKDLVSF